MSHVFVVDTSVVDRAAYPTKQDREFNEAIKCSQFLLKIYDKCHKIVLAKEIRDEYTESLAKLSKRHAKYFLHVHRFLEKMMSRNKVLWVEPKVKTKVEIHGKDEIFFDVVASIPYTKKLLVSLENRILNLKGSKEVKKHNISIMGIEEAMNYVN